MLIEAAAAVVGVGRSRGAVGVPEIGEVAGGMLFLSIQISVLCQYLGLTRSRRGERSLWLGTAESACGGNGESMSARQGQVWSVRSPLLVAALQIVE